MKKKLSLTEKISLAENNAVDFMHACVTIALHDEYEVGVQRLRKVNLRRDEINEEMLEVMAQPRKSGREQAAAGQAWLVSLLPEGAETEFRVPLGRFCRCARDAYKTDVQVEDIPDAQALHQQQRQTRQALDGLAERAWLVEASRKRVGCLPLAPAEVEKRIQTVLQAPAMPESWERRRAR